MVKRIAIVLFLGMTMVFSGCSSNSQEASSASSSAAASQSSAQEPASSDTSSEQAVSVDENLLSVEIVMPAYFFEGSEPQDVIAEAEAAGIEASPNDDGSYTYKMSKSQYNDMMDEIKITLDEALKDIYESGDYPSVKLVEADSEYKNFKMYVDREEFESSFDSFAKLNVYVSSLMYHVFTGDDYRINISLIDNDTKEEFSSELYPPDEALEEEGAQ